MVNKILRKYWKIIAGIVILMLISSVAIFNFMMKEDGDSKATQTEGDTLGTSSTSAPTPAPTLASEPTPSPTSTSISALTATPTVTPIVTAKVTPGVTTTPTPTPIPKAGPTKTSAATPVPIATSTKAPQVEEVNTNRLIPYDKSNPIIYDNDSHADVYTDELLIAIASAGEINLRGLITSSPENKYVNKETYILDVAGRKGIVEIARRSGLKNIPDPVRGPNVALTKPTSGLIDDTKPIDTEGSRLIIKEAHKATKEKPLVVIMGGPLTVAADAYLLDPTIADKVIVSWLGGNANDMGDYNGTTDGWAANIVMQKLKMVIFTPGYAEASVPRDRILQELPDCEFRQWLYDKKLNHVKLQGRDGDGQPVIPLINEAYVVDVRRVSFNNLIEKYGAMVPSFKTDSNGSAILVTAASKFIADQAWWKGINLPFADKNIARSLTKAQRPYYAVALPIGPGLLQRFDAQDFDQGAQGIAFYRLNTGTVYTADRTRHCNFKIIFAGDIPGGYNLGSQGGYCITEMKSGEWLEYTLNIQQAGTYDIGVRVAAQGNGGSFHIEFDGINKTENVSIPDTGGSKTWKTVVIPNVQLKQGLQIMRFVADTNGENGSLGNINYFEIK